MKGDPGQSSAPSWRLITRPESRWAVFAAVVVVILGQTWVARSLSLRPVWVLPGLAALLLAGSVAVYLPSRAIPRPALRRLSVALVSALVLTSFVSLVYLVRGVFVGSRLTPPRLLVTGMVLWVMNLVVFALVFWEIDGGGPEARADGYQDYPDLVFPQQQSDQAALAPPDWKPMFVDYLFVSFTAATAFSPTDTMPYTRRAKSAMAVESGLSFAILAMLVARAINIATG